MNNIKEKFVKSPGSGGQNVNKVNTKVELKFNINCLTIEEQEKLKTNFKNKINKDNELIITAAKHRTQFKNRKEALNKLNNILNTLIIIKKERKECEIPTYINEKRIKKKKIRSDIKQNRKKIYVRI